MVGWLWVPSVPYGRFLRSHSERQHIKSATMDKVFWIIPGQLAGRPGPDREPWHLATLRQAGIGAVLSVNEGLLCHPEEFVALGMSYACVPLPDNAPPLPGDEYVCMSALPRAYTFVEDEIRKGLSVLVHCSAGKDRTGLFLSYFLMRRCGLSVRKAIESVRFVRPIALTAAGWEGFAEEILAQCV
jgi:hypothetical protein